MKKPYITKDLVEYVEKLYPVKLPELEESVAQIYFNAGKADVARHIRELYNKQEEENVLS